MDAPDVETTVRGLLAASGLSLTDTQVEKFVRVYPTLRAAADELWAVPEIRYEQPAVIYHAEVPGKA
jgi:hypothetical protein